MTTATRQRIEEVYTNPVTGEVNSIRYFRDWHEHARTRRFVVVHEMTAEGIRPDVFRHATIEEARETWKRLRKLMASRDYTRRTK